MLYMYWGLWGLGAAKWLFGIHSNFSSDLIEVSILK